MILVDSILLAVGELPLRGRGRALSQRLQAAVHAGALPAGELLPGARTLADALGVARGTMVAALDEAAGLGLLSAEERRGYRVATLPAPQDMSGLPKVRRPTFSPGVGDLGLFPRAGWMASMREAIGALSNAEFGYPATGGFPQLREALAEHLANSRGAVVSPSNVVVVSGVAQAFAVLAAVARSAGMRRWYVEDPQPPSIREQLRHHGCELALLPVDAAGASAETVGEAGIVLLTPANQAPTGVTMSGERRREFIARARTAGAMIVEDDYDGDLPLARERRTVMQAADPSRIMLCGSVSKTLAPGVRLGWVCAPEDWAEAIAAERAHHDLGSGILDQAALARFLNSGRYQRHLRRVREVYRARRHALLAACDMTGIEPTSRRPDGLQLCFPIACERIDAAHQLAASRLPLQVVPSVRGAHLILGVPMIAERDAPDTIQRISRAIRTERPSPERA